MNTPYKRFLLFSINQYNQAGGKDGVEGSFDTVEEAQEFIRLAHQEADRQRARSGYEYRKYYELLDLVDRVWDELV